MAYTETTTYTIDQFKGIDQSQPENRLAPGYTKDCANMNTENGNLSVGYGYRKHINVAIPTQDNIHRMYYWHTLADDKFVVCAGTKVYAWNGSSWDSIYDYANSLNFTQFTVYSPYVTSTVRGYELNVPEGWEYKSGSLINFTLTSGEGSPKKSVFEVKINNVVYTLKKYRSYPSGYNLKLRLTDGQCEDISDYLESDKWDFVETRIGNDDYLIIANGRTHLIKWKGTGNAEAFGTGEYVYEGTASDFTYNATKALSVLYDEYSTSSSYSTTVATKTALTMTGTSAKITLTMPSGWAFSSGVSVSFISPIEANKCSQIIINDGTNDHTMTYVPFWKKGDFVTVVLTGTTTANESAGSYVSTVGVFTAYMPDTWTSGNIAFTVPKDMSSLSTLYLNVNDKKYKFDSIPMWSSGDTVVVELGKDEYICTESASTKAIAVSYTEASNVGTYTITMPQDWQYTDNCYIYFVVPTAKTSATSTVLKVNSTDYSMATVQSWAVGDKCLIQLRSGTACYQHTSTTATGSTFVKTNYDGKLTLTMPAGWSYTENEFVRFGVPSDVGTLGKIELVIGDKTFNMEVMPKWKHESETDVATVTAYNSGTSTVTCSTLSAEAQTAIASTVKIGSTEYNVSSVTATTIVLSGVGETVPQANQKVYATLVNEYMVRLSDNREAKESEDEYGITKVLLSSAIGSDWKQRCIDIGLVLNDTTEEVKEVSEDRLTVTFKEPVTEIPELGCTAKVRGGVSNIKVNFVEMYFSRLFSAGDPEHPSRLYWSQPPGDTRDIDDWSQDENSETTSGGFTEVGQTSSDPIIGLCALSNQLVIFKESSIYRLLGDRPSNYRVSAVNRDLESTVNTAIIANGDVPYWLTKAGLYYHDGQTAHLAANARQIHEILENVNISTMKSCENRDRLYFTCKAGTGTYDDSIIVYDMVDRTYLLRNGFEVIDLCAFNGSMYMINSNRYVYIWDKETHTYDGEKINAYWYTPMTDLGAMSFNKALKDMYARGEGEIVGIDTQVGKFVEHHFYQMPLEQGETLRIPMKNQGKVFGFKLYNQEGSNFTVYGGLEVKYELKED